MVPLSNFCFYLTSVRCHKKMSLLREPGLSPVHAQIFLVQWFVSGSVQNCCCWCSDKGWHLKTVCSFCWKLMLLNHVEHNIVSSIGVSGFAWCVWEGIVLLMGSTPSCCIRVVIAVSWVEMVWSAPWDFSPLWEGFTSICFLYLESPSVFYLFLSLSFIFSFLILTLTTFISLFSLIARLVPERSYFK